MDVRYVVVFDIEARTLCCYCDAVVESWHLDVTVRGDSFGLSLKAGQDRLLYIQDDWLPPKLNQRIKLPVRLPRRRGGRRVADRASGADLTYQHCTRV